MLDNALCVGYLPGFLGHWLVVLRVLAAVVVLFMFKIKLELGEGKHIAGGGGLEAWVEVDVA